MQWQVTEAGRRHFPRLSFLQPCNLVSQEAKTSRATEAMASSCFAGWPGVRQPYNVAWVKQGL